MVNRVFVMRVLSLGLLLMSVWSCSSNDEYLQITVVDEVYLSTFVDELDSRGVPYTVDGNVVKYPERYQDEVKHALANVNQDYPALFTLIDKSLMLKFRQALIDEDVPYEEKRDIDGNYVFIVDRKYRGLASRLLSTVRQQQ